MPNLFDISGQRQPIDLQFTDWLPDRPPFANPGFPNCENVYPADDGLYRPVPRFSIVSNNTIKDIIPNATQVIGQVFGARASGVRAYFTAVRDTTAGTVRFLRYVESTELWEDVTPAVPPTFQNGDHAYFDTFGTRIYAAFSTSTRILAKNIADNGLFTEITDAPRPQDIALVRGFLVAINHVQGSGGGATVRNGVSWSQGGDPEGWPDPTLASSFAVLRGRTQLVGGGQLQRIIPGINGADAIIFGESKIWRMTFIGPPAVWDFQIIADSEGTSMPTTVISSGDFIYFHGLRGWMRTDGVNFEPVGAGKVDRAFNRSDVLGGAFRLNAVSLLDVNLGIRAALSGDPITDRLVLWTYQTGGELALEALQDDAAATIQDDLGNPIEAATGSTDNDTLLILNENSGRWGNARVTLLGMGRVNTSRTRRDTPRFVGIDVAMNLVQFSETSLLDSFFDTPEAIGAANNRITVRQVWPYVDSENCTISMFARDKFNDTPVQSAQRGRESDDAIPVHESGRYVSLRLTLPGSDFWSALHGLSVDFQDQGLGSVNG